MSRDTDKRLARLEDASRANPAGDECWALIGAALSRLDDWRASVGLLFERDGEPHGWPDFPRLRRFTQSCIMLAWIMREHGAEEESSLFAWHLCHRLYLLRHCDPERALCLTATDAPIEQALMRALLADGPDVLAMLEVERSPCRTDLPPVESLGALFGLSSTGVTE